MNIRVKNSYGKHREVKLGFSWTALLFGVFVPLFRGDWKWFLIILLAEIVLGAISMGVVTVILMLAFPFFYNKLYAKDLYEDGYRGLTKDEDDALIAYIS